MPMSEFTQEQIMAYAELNAAIENCLRAHHQEYDDFVLSDFIVLTTIQKFGADEDKVFTHYPALFKNGDMPWYIIHGLVQKHTLEFNRMSLEGNDNG
jgi:hypothetical protein